MQQKESVKVSGPLRKMLESRGWLTIKMHGNKYQSGIPDLYCTHPEHGHKWIETKLASGSLTRSQRAMFKKLTDHGDSVYVIFDPNTVFEVIFNKPNWWKWL